MIVETNTNYCPFYLLILLLVCSRRISYLQTIVRASTLISYTNFRIDKFIIIFVVAIEISLVPFFVFMFYSHY